MFQQKNNPSVVGRKTIQVILLLLLVSTIAVSSADTQHAINYQITNKDDLNNTNVVSTDSISTSKLGLDTYTPHAPIYIGGEQNIIDLGFPGSGTAISPYLISGLSIEDQYASALIDIRSVNVHILITNNFLNGTLSVYHGIYIQNSENVKIVNNIIRVQETASSAPGAAITISGASSNNIVNNNQIMKSDWGVNLQTYYLAPTAPTQNIISYNDFSDISGYGIIIQSLTNNMILSNNTLDHNTFTNVVLAISLKSTVSSGGTSNSTVSNNLIVDSSTGIELNTVSYEYQYPNINRGITLLNNTINRPSWIGIYINQHSFNNLINNTVTNGQDIGMYLYQTVNNTLDGNFVYKNGKEGTKLDASTSNKLTANNTLIHNVVANNSAITYYSGIYLGNLARRTEITDNTITNNTGLGIEVQTRGAPYNYIARNDFIDNNGGLNQADSQVSNIFEYNYWSDWIEPDVDNNGVVDNPYVVSASRSVEDPFPLTHRNTGEIVSVAPPNAPEITHPDDIEMEYKTYTTLSWSANSTGPDTFTIYKNGTIYDSGNWDGSDITVDLYNLDLGWYNFTIILSDSYSQTTGDIVLVLVIDTAAPEVFGPSQFTIAPSYQKEIQWYAYDTHPSTYNILVNGSLADSGEWAPEVNITYIFSKQVEGIYNLTLVVFDTSGNQNSHSVIITVKLLDDFSAPTISSPQDIAYKDGKTGNQITWQVFDDYPGMYTLYLDNSIDRSGEWSSGHIIVSADGLAIGQHNFTIVLSDQSGNSVSDTVLVTVEENSSSSTATSESIVPSNPSSSNGNAPFGFIYGVFGIVVISPLIPLINKNRKSRARQIVN